MTLSDIANLVEIIGIVAIIFGIVFGLLQLRQHRKQSHDMAILELARSFEWILLSESELSWACTLFGILISSSFSLSDLLPDSCRTPASRACNNSPTLVGLGAVPVR